LDVTVRQVQSHGREIIQVVRPVRAGEKVAFFLAELQEGGGGMWEPDHIGGPSDTPANRNRGGPNISQKFICLLVLGAILNSL
jgi:hypothetical protein